MRSMKGLTGLKFISISLLPAVVLTIAFLVLSPASASAAEWNPLPDTGQEKCYDNSGEIPCPQPGEPFYGQDAQYNGPEPTYQDNGDGTVTDLNTGFMWQQATADTNNDGTITYNDGTIPYEDVLTWQEAMDYCDTLTFADHSDWRLPAKFELQSIVDYGRFSPAINPVFSCPWSGHYWSATPYVVVHDSAWSVIFSSGKENFHSNIFAHLYVRCVRGGL
jgi:hypothetical protein